MIDFTHFENLWEYCEFLNKDKFSETIFDELLMKINLYKAFDSKKEISIEENQKIKLRLFGEILYTLTALSFKENINVFDALTLTIKQH